MANLDPMCDVCGKERAVISDGMIGALICQTPTCFEKAWDRAHKQPRCPAGSGMACVVEGSLCTAPRCAEAWEEGWQAACDETLTGYAPTEPTYPNPYASKANPCGHPTKRDGCGGCDPSAIEYVIDHAGVRWTLDSALSALDRIAAIADEMGSATTYDEWEALCVRLRSELGKGVEADD